MMKYVNERHNFRNGDNVTVTRRNAPEKKYDGTIYTILKNPLQKGIRNSPLIDHFYITFDKSVYERIIGR